MLDTLAVKLEEFSLEINVKKSCNIVFKHGNKIISTSLTLQGHPLKQVSECVYLGVALIWRALVMWNGLNVLLSNNIIQYKKISVILIPTDCYIFYNARYII